MSEFGRTGLSCNRCFFSLYNCTAPYLRCYNPLCLFVHWNCFSSLAGSLRTYQVICCATQRLLVLAQEQALVVWLDMSITSTTWALVPAPALEPQARAQALAQTRVMAPVVLALAAATLAPM